MLLFPLKLSLQVAALSTLLSFCMALLVARILAKRNGVFPKCIDALCTLPLVLPPTVLGT